MQLRAKILVFTLVLILVVVAVFAFGLREGGGNIYGIGNTPGNIPNHSRVAYQDGWIYYVLSTGLYRKRIDGTEQIWICDDIGVSTAIHVAGDWIYFTRPHQLGSNVATLHRMRTDGTNREMINNVWSGLINVVDGWIYFSIIDDFRFYGIYRMRTDGTQKEQLRLGRIGSLSVADGWMYFVCHYESPRIHRMRIDGTEEVRFNDSKSATMLVVYDEWVYYIAWRNEYDKEDDSFRTLRRVRREGTNDEEISSIRMHAFTVYDNKIFFIPEADDRLMQRLYKMRLDGSEKDRLHSVNEAIGIIYTSAGWIYFSEHFLMPLSYRVRTDGTGLESLRLN